MPLSPARLEPIFSPRPWGVLSLAPLFPEKSNLTEPIGEAWMTGNECRFANGDFAGKTLAEAWPQMSPEWTGDPLSGAGASAERPDLFPLLVKFIFANEKLSVQVHPDDAYASRHEKAAGGKGKTEMWYTLRAQDNAAVLAGLKPGVTRDSFKSAIGSGSAEDCIESVSMRPGEAIFIPAGTAHTIGPGLVLCEIQQHSDLTYRVYDYNRRDAQGNARPLHIDKALEVMRFGKQTCAKLEPVAIPDGPAKSVKKEYLVACPYFVTERWQLSGPLALASSPHHLDILIFLEGQGSLQWRGAEAAYKPAQVWLIPAALGEFRIEPAPGSDATTILRTYAPPSLDHFARELTHRGIPASAAQSLIHR
jgi:mannose-6-phosphate isomerase